MFETKKYGFEVGQVVRTRVEIADENEKTIPANTLMRIVAIAPKVRRTSPFMIKERPQHNDNKEFFVNLVDGQSFKDFPRARVNFITIRKLNKTEKKSVWGNRAIMIATGELQEVDLLD
jgi:hypothetical protein